MNETIHEFHYQSPMGVILIKSEQENIVELSFCDTDIEKLQSQTNDDVTKKCVQQLKEYFNKQRTVFDLPLNPKGTDFQKKVWKELLNIPYGRTISYMELAKSLGNPKKVRAVANANAKNKIPVIIPCHRVIGADGSLTGFGGGLWRKQYLLELEGIQGDLFNGFH